MQVMWEHGRILDEVWRDAGDSGGIFFLGELSVTVESKDADEGLAGWDGGSVNRVGNGR